MSVVISSSKIRYSKAIHNVGIEVGFIDELLSVVQRYDIRKQFTTDPDDEGHCVELLSVVQRYDIRKQFTTQLRVYNGGDRLLSVVQRYDIRKQFTTLVSK